MSTDVLKYGDRVHLENGYNSWQGGFLDTANASVQGGKYDVSTANSPKRAVGSGSWVLTSADGKKLGEDVVSGDSIYLQNLYQGDGGYLDTAGSAPASPDLYMVHTFAKADRDSSGTSHWQIIAKTSNPSDNKVREGDPIHLQNGYNNMAGGFLQAFDNQAGNKYNVNTSAYSDRNNGSATWRFSKVPPRTPLKYGDKVHIQNGHSNWQGGYLDTFNSSASVGGLYEVATQPSPTRTTLGTGIWMILSPTGKKIGDEVMAQDRIYLVNQYNNNGGYLDICGAATPAPNLFKVITYGRPDRDGNGTCQWRVVVQTSFPADGKLREDDIFHLQNFYNSSRGGFLDAVDAVLSNSVHNVVTGYYWNRVDGSGSWRFTKV